MEVFNRFVFLFLVFFFATLIVCCFIDDARAATKKEDEDGVVVGRAVEWLENFTTIGDFVVLTKPAINVTIREEGVKIPDANVDMKVYKNSTLIIVNQSLSSEVEVKYYTQGPQKKEEKIKKGKKITVSSDVHYENITSFTNVAERKFKLYHIVNGSRVQVKYEKFDNNKDGLVDYIEWSVPSLSNQTYELIYAVAAEHLDENRTFIEDVFDYIKERDENYTTIPAEDYLRVTFEENLTNQNYIEVYAKSKGASIEVYLANSTDLIYNKTGINKNGSYKLYLTNLTGVNDTFDLKVVGNSIDFDYIVDPVAVYNASFGAPYCSGITSPCIAGSDLLKSVDSIATPEPNQPNTIDACTDGASGTYQTDESVENITVTTLNGSTFEPGDTVQVDAWVYCFDGTNDNINFVYTNDTTTPAWTVEGFVDPCPGVGFNKFSLNITLDDVEGYHAVRVINQFQGNTSVTCGAGNYDDNDDLVFKASTSLPTIGNLTLNATSKNNLTTDNLTCNYDLNDTSISAAVAWYKNNSPEMVLYMPFDTAGLDGLRDYSGKGNDGTNTGAEYNATAGYDGLGAYKFTPSENDYIVMSDSTDWDFTGPFSISTWIRTTSNPSGLDGIVSRGESSPFPWILRFSGGNLQFIIDNNVTAYSFVPTIGKWYNLVADWNGSHKNIYINSSLAISEYYPSAPTANSDPVYIGNDWVVGADRTFPGWIDEVRIYNHSLTEQQISILYDGDKNKVGSNETILGDVWRCDVTPFSNTTAGNTVESNNLTILPPPDNLPSWSNNQTNIVSTYSPTTLSFFNITWTDDNGADTVLFESNFSGVNTNYTMNNIVGDVYNYSAILPAGSYYWKSYANDTIGQVNETDTWYFTIDKVTSSITLYINGTSADYKENVSFDANLTCELSTPSGLIINLSQDGTTLNYGVTPQTNISTYSTPSNYLINCSFEENQNYTSTHDSHFVNATDAVKPVVTLTSPADNYNDADTQYVDLTFTADITDNFNLSNCSLWHNISGSWQVNETDSTVTGVSDTASVTLNDLSNVSFIWNYECYDINGNFGWGASNRTATLNWTPPITLYLDFFLTDFGNYSEVGCFTLYGGNEWCSNKVDNDLNISGTLQANAYKSSDGTLGITDTTSYWQCTASDCSTTCQVQIKNGLEVGCT